MTGISAVDPPPVATSRVPRPAMWLGLAGLIPQIWVVTILLFGNPEARFSALALGFAYAALILSFIGGMWWGLAAQARTAVANWVWVVAVAPSLLALASAIPWAIGAEWPGPSLVLLGLILAASLVVDHRLVRRGWAPAWWLALRIPLSIGLGGLTLAIGYMA